MEHYYPAIYESAEVFLDTADVVVDATVESSEVRSVNSSNEVRLDQEPPAGDDPANNPELGATSDEPNPPSSDVQIYTYYTVKVHQVRNTDRHPGELITVRIPGGEFEGVRYVADVFPTLETNKTYVLVLVEAVEDVYAPLSPGQSTYVRTRSGTLEPLPTGASLWDVADDGSRDTTAERFDRTINTLLSESLTS